MVGVDDDYSGDGGGGVFGAEVHLVVLIHEVVQQPAFVRPAVSSCNWCNDDDDHDDGDDDMMIFTRRSDGFCAQQRLFECFRGNILVLSLQPFFYYRGLFSLSFFVVIFLLCICASTGFDILRLWLVGV